MVAGEGGGGRKLVVGELARGVFELFPHRDACSVFGDEGGRRSAAAVEGGPTGRHLCLEQSHEAVEVEVVVFLMHSRAEYGLEVCVCYRPCPCPCYGHTRGADTATKRGKGAADLVPKHIAAALDIPQWHG